MENSEVYNDKFLTRQANGSYPSAQVIVPLVLDLIQAKSVVDIGCGFGAWLKVFQEKGVIDILGVDGDYVNREKLYIPQDKFLAHDLDKPLHLDKRFDLVLSVEVGEHLSDDKAEEFVKTLTSLSDVIVFSAAIPGQGGKDINHINEQWPEYWQRLFRKRRYELLDPFRMKIFYNHKVDWWYRQNIMLAVKRKLLDKGKFNGIPVHNSSMRIIYSGLFTKNHWTKREK